MKNQTKKNQKSKIKNFVKNPKSVQKLKNLFNNSKSDQK